MDSEAGSHDAPLGDLRNGLHELSNQLAVVVGTMELIAFSDEVPSHLRELARGSMTNADEATRILGRLQRIVGRPAQHPR